MTWREWLAARRLLAEETVGINARQARQAEDEIFARSRRNYDKMMK